MLTLFRQWLPGIVWIPFLPGGTLLLGSLARYDELYDLRREPRERRSLKRKISKKQDVTKNEPRTSRTKQASLSHILASESTPTPSTFPTDALKETTKSSTTPTNPWIGGGLWEPSKPALSRLSQSGRL